ncbi:PDDEXK nuclease domain-containing protein [Oerskovia sp. M15]
MVAVEPEEHAPHRGGVANARRVRPTTCWPIALGHVVVLLERLQSREERDWYAARAAQDGWSRAVLEHQIKAGLRSALGAAPTNFMTALEEVDSELAQQLVKDPYVFEHLAMVERVAERDVEQALMDRLQDTMLELGRGMAFVGGRSA